MLKKYWVNYIDKSYSKKKYQRPTFYDLKFVKYMKDYLKKFKNSKDKIIIIQNILNLIKKNKMNFNFLFKIFIYLKWKENNSF